MSTAGTRSAIVTGGARGSRTRPRSLPLDARELLAVVGLTVVAAAVRFAYIGHQGFWFDEANTALLVRFSPGKMIGLIPQTESTPPFFYCVAWVWARVFGDHEAGLRSLSALCGVLAVPIAWAAARRLLGVRGGIVVCALTACNPLLIWYSQEARSYEMLVFFSAATLLGFALVRSDPRARNVALWVIASALALATHYYGVVVVIPEAAWLLWEHRRNRAVQVGVGIAVLCGLALIPLAASQNATGHDSWIANSPFGLRLAQIIPQFLIGTDSPLRKPLKFVAMALALVGLALLIVSLRRGRGGWARSDAVDGASGAVLAGGLAVGGFALSLAFVAAGSDALITRNIIGLWLPAAVCVGGGLALAPGRLARLGTLATAGLCAIGLTAAIGVDANYNLQRPNWRPVAAALTAGTPSAGTTRLLLIQHYRTLLPLSLYVPHLTFLKLPTAPDVREIDVISIRSPQQPLCWWGAACNLIPSQMQRTYAIPGFRVAGRRQVEQFTILRLLSARPRGVSQAAVSRSLRTTTLHRDDLLIQRS